MPLGTPGVFSESGDGMNDSPPNEQRQRKTLAQIAEIRRMVLAIDFALNKVRPASMLVTSAQKQEGKSLLAAGLATAAASLGDRRVVAIDLNWYRPSLHRFFGCELRDPIETLMTAPVADLVQPGAPGEPDLILAPIDHNRPDSVLAKGPEMARRLIAGAREAYDLVIIDAASIFPTNRMMMDPVMLSSMVDGVAMVVLADVTARQQVKHAHKTIQTTGSHVLGMIVNRRQPHANA